jgi:AcrR family transcriptional regulator
VSRTVDHERRRRELADAAITVVRASGLDGLTVRRVAAEAGWSTGSLAHYFGSKDELLQAAHQRVIERIFERAGAPDHPKPPLEQLRAALLSVLPIDDEQRAELTVWLAFVARALTRRDFAEQRLADRNEWVAQLEGLVANAQRDGAVPADRDPRREATELSLLTDGLALQALVFKRDGMQPAEQIARVDAALARLAKP